MRFLLILVACLFCAGCGMDRKTQLQQVARDWCLTITASQVVPVYPLTEDLQPGDVFLVQMPIEEQRARYDDKGFLPLDHHKARLTPDAYKDFYRDMFVMPLDGSPRRFTRELQRGNDGNSNWSTAPAAAFPTYAVSVSRSEGVNIGVPLYGIPVGLSLLDAEQATASISIASARTIGVDVDSLSKQLDIWAAKSEASLRPYASSGKKRNYLRVVFRIYVTGGVDISLADSRSGSAGIDAGKPRPVDLLSPSTATSLTDVNATRVENSRRAISVLNAGLAESLSPTSASGSNDNASTTDIDARTKAKLDEMKKLREAREKERTAAETEVKTKRTAAAPAQKELDDAKAKLADAEKALTEATNAPASDAAKIETATKARDAALADVKAKEAAQPLKDLAEALGKSDAAKVALQELSSVIPGGSLRVTAASSRFVTLRQDFNPPLIVGYLGFDREILLDEDGGVVLGEPIATQDRIEKSRGTPVEPNPAFLTLKSNNTPRAKQLRAAIRAQYRDTQGNVLQDKLRKLDTIRLELFPTSEKMGGFGLWLQSSPEARLQVLMEKASIPIPPAQ